MARRDGVRWCAMLAARLSGLGVRHAMVACSAVVHAAILGAFAGHASGVSVLEAQVMDAPIAVETIPEAEPMAPSVAPEPRPARVAVPHTHVHPYPVPASHDAMPHDPSIVHAWPARAHTHEAEEHAEAKDTLAAPAPAPARFTMAFGQAAMAHGFAEAAPAHDAFDAANAPEPFAEGTVTRPARMLDEVKPPYPAEARAEGVEAEVPMEIVVDARGRVTSARVLRRAGLGFDEAALSAIRAFRFAPAERAGRAVPVRMAWTMSFQL
jgi:protein TonB